MNAIETNTVPFLLFILFCENLKLPKKIKNFWTNCPMKWNQWIKNTKKKNSKNNITLVIFHAKNSSTLSIWQNWWNSWLWRLFARKLPIWLINGFLLWSFYSSFVWLTHRKTSTANKTVATFVVKIKWKMSELHDHLLQEIDQSSFLFCWRNYWTTTKRIDIEIVRCSSSKIAIAADFGHRLCHWMIAISCRSTSFSYRLVDRLIFPFL